MSARQHAREGGIHGRRARCAGQAREYAPAADGAAVALAYGERGSSRRTRTRVGERGVTNGGLGVVSGG